MSSTIKMHQFDQNPCHHNKDASLHLSKRLSIFTFYFHITASFRIFIGTNHVFSARNVRSVCFINHSRPRREIFYAVDVMTKYLDQIG